MNTPNEIALEAVLTVYLRRGFLVPAHKEEILEYVWQRHDALCGHVPRDNPAVQRSFNESKACVDRIFGCV